MHADEKDEHEKAAALAAARKKVEDLTINRSEELKQEKEFNSEEALRIAQDQLEDARRQLEDLQAYTIFTLVEPIQLPNGQMSKLLFLTNAQASSLDITPLDRFIDAFGITPRPKLVINFFDSPMISPAGARNELSWRDVERGAGPGDASKLPCFHAEFGDAGLQDTERRIIAMLRESVLPIVRKTNALVILRRSWCGLCRCFGKICQTEAKRYGGKLPFTVLHINEAENYQYASSKAGSLVYQLRQGSPRWQTMAPAIDSMRLARNFRGPWESGQMCLDAPAGCTHYIIVDSVDAQTKRFAPGPANALAAKLVQQFATELPNIGFTSFFPTWGIGGMGQLADYTGRNLHLVILDSREAQRDDTIEAARNELIALGKRLEEEQKSVNIYYVSAFARLHSAMQNEMKLTSTDGGDVLRGKLLCDITKQAATSMRGEKEPEGNRSQSQVVPTEADANSGYPEAQLRTSVEEEALNRRRTAERAVGALLSVLQENNSAWVERLGPSMIESEIEEIQSELERVTDTAGMDALLRNFSLRWIGLRGVNERIHQLVFQFPDCFVPHVEGTWGIIAKLKEGVSLQPCVSALQTFIQGLEDEKKSSSLSRKPRFYGPVQAQISSELHDALVETMMSPFTHSCNVCNLNEMATTIKQIARIDRLPPSNSIEGLHILLRAWENVDVYNAASTRAKWVAKVSFVLMLLVAMLITILGVVSVNQPGQLPQPKLDAAVLSLTIVGSSLVSLVAFINPGTKWRQLRGSAQTLESEIWKYRTRSNEYAIDTTMAQALASRMPDEKLRQATETLSSHVMKSSSVADTDFLSRFSGLLGAPSGKQDFRHGQHPGCRRDGTFGQATELDDHHSPITPFEYLELRVKPQLAFYLKRMPRYYRSRIVLEALLVASSYSGLILAFSNLSSWAAVSAAIATSLTAYAKFLQPEQKLSRYSDLVAGIKSVLLWWSSLSDVEQASQNNTNELIKRCEGHFQTERQAWVSTTIADVLAETADRMLSQSDKEEPSRKRGKQ